MNESKNTMAFPPGLELDDVHVWIVSLEFRSHELTESFCTLLSLQEREAAETFFFESDQVRYVISRGCLRRLLSSYLGTDPSRIAFSLDTYGKPKLAREMRQRLQFNLSHSGEWAAYVMSRERAVGIDIEPVRSDVPWQGLLKEVFSPAEAAQLFELPIGERLETFLRVWTRKESFLKGIGYGLTMQMTDFEVSPLPLLSPVRISRISDTVQVYPNWWLYPFENKATLIGSVAVEGAQTEIKSHFCSSRELLSVK